MTNWHVLKMSKLKKKILIYLTVYLIFTDDEQGFSESEKKIIIFTS